MPIKKKTVDNAVQCSVIFLEKAVGELLIQLN